MYVYGKKRCRIDVESIGTASSSFYIQSVVSVLRQSGGRRKEKQRGREKEKERTMYFYMAFSERKRGMDRSIGMCVWKVGGRKEKEKERELEAASNATRKRERERSDDRPAPEEYKFMSMQHKVASTTSQPIHTHLYPQLSAATPCARFPDRPLRHSSTRSYRSR